MKKYLVGLLTAVLMMFAVPANADTGNHYGETASWVGKYELGCKNWRNTPDGRMYLDAGVCRLKGHRVNVITFEGPRQQAAWNRMAVRSFGPRFHWAQTKGAVIVARNGNKPAAVAGAKALEGSVKHG